MESSDVEMGSSGKPMPNKNTEKLKTLMRQLSDTSPVTMSGSSNSLAQRYTRIFMVVALYWFVSITLVFLNKALLSDGSTSIDAPLFITCFQCAITAAACYGIASLPPNFGETLACGQITISLQILQKVLPLSVVFVAMITFNNLCLKNVGVSFYYIGRSLTTVFNVVFTYLILGQKTSSRAIICCFIIIFGFWLGVDQESGSGTFSFRGTVYGVLASAFVSLYAIYIKRILPVVDNNVWMMTFYNNVNAILLFIPLMLVFGEIPVIASSDVIFSPSFWLLMVLGGGFGCAIGYVTGMQVKVTSPLTHNISGTAKAAAQTVLATHVNAEVKPFWWWVSNAVVLFGSAMYARTRQLEMASETQKEILPSTSKTEAEQTSKSKESIS